MCGRFALKTPPLKIQEHFYLPEEVDLPPRYNIAPSQNIAVVRQLPGNSFRNLNLLRWGLVPFWAGDIKIGHRLINARGETVSEKPSFRAAFRKRRCLIPADGFYEWLHTGSTKQPMFLQLTGATLFSFAGLWESWTGPDGSRLESCTIITTKPNALIRHVHDRMPVILHPDQYDSWLQEITPPPVLQKMLSPYPAEGMEMYPVSQAVNSPKNDTPACVEPLKQQKNSPNR
jgi:putative SOS response-associated peptidase YedK